MDFRLMTVFEGLEFACSRTDWEIDVLSSGLSEDFLRFQSDRGVTQGAATGKTQAK